MDLKLETFGVDADPRIFAAGERIFRVDKAGAEMYVVVEGEVELRVGEQLLETLGPGQPFGEMALIDRAPRAATAIAKTTCRLAVIPEKRFLFMVQANPPFALQIMKVMADRLRRMNALTSKQDSNG